MTVQRLAMRGHQELVTAASELERILHTIESSGFRSLDPADAERLPELIRNASTALAAARSSGMNEPLVQYLESLLHQSWLALRDAKRGYLRGQAQLWLQTIPSVLWGARWLLLFAMLLVLCGAYIGFQWVQGDPYTARRLFPASLAEYIPLLEDPALARQALAASHEHILLALVSMDGMLLWFFGGYAAIALLNVYFGAVLTPFLLIGAGAALGALLSLFPPELRGSALLQVLPYAGVHIASMVFAFAAGVRTVGSLFSHGQATRRADIAYRLQEGMVLLYVAIAHALLSLPMFALGMVTLANDGGRALLIAGWLVSILFYVTILGGLPQLEAPLIPRRFRRTR